jgi:hypothetical protein
MSDNEEFDDQPILSDEESPAVEMALSAAIRFSQKYDTEFDEECRPISGGNR